MLDRRLIAQSAVQAVFFTTILIGGIVPQALHAQTPSPIHAWRPVAALELEQTATEVLNPRHQYNIHMWNYAKENAAPASGVRILYQSQTPLVLRYSPIGAYDVDVLLAVLPAAENGDAVIPLLQSPAWNSWSGGFSIQFYGIEEAPPVIGDVILMQDASFFGTLWAYMTQPFQREYLDISSSNFLLGYRIGNVSLTLLMGVIMILLCSILCLRRFRPVSVLVIVCVSAIGLYQVRFLLDETRNAYADLSEQLGHNTYKQMGDSFAMADFLKEETQGAEGPVDVTDCGQMTTAMRYFLFPIPVTSAADTWNTASYGTLSAPWLERHGTIYCNGLSRSGSVLQIFNGGSAVVRFSSAH